MKRFSKMALPGLACISIALLLSLPANGQNDENLKEISKGIEKFSISLFLRCALDMKDKNVVLSPFSVWSMLAVLSEGAGSGSLTKGELLGVLAYPPTGKLTPSNVFSALAPKFAVNTSTVTLETINTIFYRNSIKVSDAYRNLVGRVYKAQLSGEDFQNPNTINKINNFVYQATRGRINEIVKPFDLVNAQMLLTNAIFFRGQWTIPFNRSDTTRATFYSDQNVPIGEVNMMFQRAPYPYANMRSFKAHVVELPYGQASCLNYVDEASDCPKLPDGRADIEENRLSMVIILPHVGVTLAEMIPLFKVVNIATLFESLKEAAIMYEEDEVDVYLPRFSASSDILLNKVLSELGLYEVFDPSYADLSGISRERGLYLSRVIHKAQIEVTEEGTVASAVTAGELSNRNTPPKVVANRPFLYLIVEKSTNVVVFGGTYTQPSLY